jgi:hypothetical protein
MKTPEQQLVDLFHKFSVQRFNHPEFARLLAESDLETQQTFFFCFSAFSAYKAGFAINFNEEINPDSLASWCIDINRFMEQRGQTVIPHLGAIHNSLI